MDTPAAQVELVRPWRTATMVATAVAGLELVLLVVLGIVVLGRSVAPHVHAAAARAAVAPKHHAAPRPAKVAPGHTAHAARLLPRSKTSILILNGNGINGAAAQAAAIVRSRGYAVTDTRNAPRAGYPTWRLMAAPGYAAEATRFARDMALARSRIGPLDGMVPRQLHGAKLVLILGASR
ncbi:MAG: LytR C-terminal domain-containing protein [Verrucomicrobiota bacterium]